MNYKKIYQQLMVRAKESNRTKGIIYYESHHIIPAFMFKANKRNKSGVNPGHMDGEPGDKQNLVLLTAREHFLAHILLYKILKGGKYEWSAGASLLLFFNVAGAKHQRLTHGNFFNLGKKYEKYREIGLVSISNRRKGMMPVKDAITWIMVGEAGVTNPKVLSGEWVHHSKGVPHSPEQNRRQSEMQRGMKNGNALSDFTKEEAMNVILSVYKNEKDNRDIISESGHIHGGKFMEKVAIYMHGMYPFRKKAPSVVIFNRLGSRNIADILNIELNTSLIRCGMKIKFPGSLKRKPKC